MGRASKGFLVIAVARARARRDQAETDFIAAIRRAARAGATVRELEAPSGLKKSRLAQIVKAG